MRSTTRFRQGRIRESMRHRPLPSARAVHLMSRGLFTMARSQPPRSSANRSCRAAHHSTTVYCPGCGCPPAAVISVTMFAAYLAVNELLARHAPLPRSKRKKRLPTPQRRSPRQHGTDNGSGGSPRPCFLTGGDRRRSRSRVCLNSQKGKGIEPPHWCGGNSLPDRSWNACTLACFRLCKRIVEDYLPKQLQKKPDFFTSCRTWPVRAGGHALSLGCKTLLHMNTSCRTSTCWV